MLELQLEIQLEGQINLEMEIQNTEIVVVEGFDYFDIDWINPTLAGGTLTADFAFSPSPQEDVTKIELWINGALSETRESNDESPFVVEDVNSAAEVVIKAYNNDLLMQESQPFQLPIPVAPDFNEFSFSSSKTIDVIAECSDPQNLDIAIKYLGIPTNGLVSILDDELISVQEIDRENPTLIPYVIENSAGVIDSGEITFHWEEISIEIDSPTEDQEIPSDEDITIAFTVTPTQQNYISAIALVVDGVEVEKRSPYSGDDFVIDAGTLTEAAHTIRIRAYDLDDVEVFETGVRSFEVGVSQQFLLDVYPNQFGESFALHRVRAGFTGDVIEVKRDDGDTQRYQLDSGELPLGAISSFIGSGNAKFPWWKGQANGLEVSQTSDGACPLLFENGVLIEENGHPALKFSGAQFMNAPASFANGNNFYSVSVGSIELADGRGVVFEMKYSIDPEYRFCIFYDTRTNKIHTIFRDDTGSTNIINNISQLNINQLYIKSAIRNQLDLIGYTNSEIQGTVQIGDSIGFDTLVIGKQTIGGGGIFHIGNISEVHFYDNDQSANRKAIEDFINTRYNAYVV